MKRMRIVQAGIALMTVMLMAMFTGCPTGDDGGNESSAKALTSITVGTVEPDDDIPTPITKAQWNDDTQYLTALTSAVGSIILTDNNALTDAVITTAVSSKAKVAYAAGSDGDRATLTFSANSTITLTAYEYLFIRVTAEDGSVNYYAFQITTTSGNANLSQLTIAGVTAGMGSPATTWDAITTAGSVSLSNTQKTSAYIVATASASSGTTTKYAKVTSAGAPTFDTDDTFTFADGDFLYIEVTAADNTTKLIYKVEIWIGRNAALSDITFGGTSVTDLGTPANTLAGVTAAGYILFTSSQPQAGYVVKIIAEDEDAEIKYAFGTDALEYYTTQLAAHVFTDGEILSVEVTSASGNVVQCYKIEVNLGQVAVIQAGSPEIKASTEKYIDPIWDTVTESYNISKIAPFADTTAAYREQGVDHPRYTYGVAKALWDSDGMYVYVDVTDAEVNGNDNGWTTSNAHQYDSFELFINEDPSTITSTPGTQTEFQTSSGQYRVGADGKLSGHATNALAAFTTLNNASAWKKDDGSGYVIIMQAPWLHGTPTTDDKIGFELQINACTGTNDRDGVMVWNNIAWSNYQTNSAYGEATLTGTPMVHAQRPQITTQPTGTFVLTGQALTLTVAADAVTDGGTLSYQWYSATAAGGAGTEIPSANSTTYAVTTSAAGVAFYYVVVTNTNNSVGGNKTTSTTSNYARVEVGSYTGPEVGEWYERITTRGRNAPIYGFDLGANKLGDFTKVTFLLKVDPYSPAKSGVARVYAPVDVVTPTNGNIALGNTTSTGVLTEQLIANVNPADISTGYDDWATYTLTMGILNGLAETTAMKNVTGLTGLAIGFFVNDGNNNSISYYIKDIVLSNAAGDVTVDALYPGHPLLWAGAGADKCGTIYGEALASRELIDTKDGEPSFMLAPPFKTLLTGRFNSDAKDYTYEDKTWWVMTTTNGIGDAVAPFNTTAATDFTAITTLLTPASTSYSRVSIDLNDIDTNWGNYSKVTLTYDLIQVGGTDLSVLFRNGTGGGSDPTVNATPGGYATALSTGNGRTVTLPIGTGDLNIKPSVSGNLAAVKNNSGNHTILLRISKIELHD